MAAEPGVDALAEARCLGDGDATPALPSAQDTLALAWALKDQCYRAWNTDPPGAVRAAALLAGLDPRGLPAAQTFALEGLVAWTAGIACVVRGQMAMAVEAFDRAASRFSQAGQPDAAAQTQVPKIMALSLLGQPTQAAECAEAAHAALLAVGNVLAAGRVSVNLGSLLLRRDAYRDASRHYRQAAVLFARCGDHLHSVLADIGLAGALTCLGDFDEALRIYARVRMRATSQALAHPLAMVDESVALLDLARGRYAEALAGMESARRRYEMLGLPHALAIAEKQLADAYLDLRLLPEALSLFEAAVTKFTGLRLPEEQAWALAQRGRAEALLGRVSAARESFAAAAGLFGESSHGVGLASVTLAQAELALAQGDAPGALAHANAAVAGFTRVDHADGLGRAEVVRAQALWQAGQHAVAQEAFERTLTLARQRQQLQVQVRCLTGQAVAAQAGGQPLAAEAALEAAIELLEDQRSALPGDEFRSAFLTEHLRPYQERLRLALASGGAAGVLLHLERYRARSLAERVDEGGPGQEAPTDEDAELRERLTWLSHRLRRLQDENEHSPMLQDELLRAERELLERARRRRLAQPGEGAMATAAFDVEALQAALGRGDALVEYGVIDDELFAVVVGSGQARLHRQLASWAQVTQALRSLHLQIDTLRHGVARVQAHLPAIARRTQLRLEQLHELLWAPLQASLAGCVRVLVVPYAELAAVPFSALQRRASQHAAAGDEPMPLGQQLQLALAPSAQSALRGLRRQAAPALTVLALGESSRLPHAAREARQVAGLFARGQALVGDAATLAALKAGAGAADVIHLACHAHFRSDNPRFSALHLHDAHLTAELAETLNLRPCTVVLSACESGLSESSAGGEMVGLVRSFLVAGAARVLAALWPVDDATTADFMAHFYGALAFGQPGALALRHAQAQLRRSHPEPYFWSAFTLYGGW